MDEKSIKAFQDTHVAAWNEKDPAKREMLLREVYADDISMFDSATVFIGLKQVSDLIGKLLAEDPAFSFSAAKPLEAVQNSARLFGQIRTSKGLLTSMDFFVFKNGKASLLYVYMAPASE